MVFTKRLREGIRRGEITCSVRFWLSPRVTAGTRYRMDEGGIAKLKRCSIFASQPLPPASKQDADLAAQSDPDACALFRRDPDFDKDPLA